MTNIDIKIEKLLKLAKKNPKNYVKIADIYFDDSNFKKAENYYKKAIENGICAYQQLGYVYDYQHQYKKAFNTYLEGIDARDIDCMIYVGYNYEVGHIVKKDIKKAIEYYMMASNLGSAIAARNLGNIYYFDMPCKDDKNENVKKALGFYERAFYLGETSITKKIGFIYLNDETLKDVKKAIEWYKKGLNLGDHSLNFDLAYIYFNDRFVPHDYEKGYAYLIDGVKNNDPESLYMQARIYEEGWYGIKADEKNIFIISRRQQNLDKMMHFLIWAIIILKGKIMIKPWTALLNMNLALLGFIGQLLRYVKIKSRIMITHLDTIKWQWKIIFQMQ